ncbi:MAG: hypothetical protein Q4E20_06830 [Eubacteriales bacterium]|nr:hypothetical protein [Eubacteriales bacterium]
MKKFICIIVCVLLLTASIPMSAYADASANSEDNRVNIVYFPLAVERVDVPLSEAMLDPTFSMEASQINKVVSKNATRDAEWKVSGWVEHSGTDNFYSKAVGMSGLYDGDTLVDKYHYTRTFFGSKNNPFGDSGRVWGTGLVIAIGTLVPTGNVMYKVHKVFYGTEED